MSIHTYPSISVVIATHNSSRTIGRCLESIRGQQYDQKRIEIVIVDGASTDETKNITSSYHVSWISSDPKKQSAEYNKSIGIRRAHHEIIAMIDHDNILPHAGWFLNMTRPFIENKNTVGVESLRYHYDPDTSLLDRYFALFGAGDPLVWYLGKADRLSYIYNTYNPPGGAIDCGSYYVVRFQPDTMPTIGANGFFVRRNLLMSYAHISHGMYFDMDINIDLIKNGFDTYAFVKDTLLHLTGYGSMWNFFKRRLLFLTQYRFTLKRELMQSRRRYGALTLRDQLKLMVAVFICLTVIVPLYDSVRGWRKIHDPAWFLHPVLCISFVMIYSYAVLRHMVFRYGQKILAK